MVWVTVVLLLNFEVAAWPALLAKTGIQLLVLVLGGFVPGLALGATFVPGWNAIHITGRWALSILLSLFVLIVTGWVLAQFRVLTTAYLFIAMTGVLIGAALLLWRRTDALRRMGDDAISFWQSYEGLLFVVAGLLTFGVFAYYLTSVVTPVRAAGFYYYQQGLEVIRAQAIPLTMREYGLDMRYLTGKLGHNLLTAVWHMLGFQYHHLATMMGMFVGLGALAFTAMWAFFRSMRPVSPAVTAVAVVMVGWSSIGLELAVSRAEATGFALLVAAIYTTHQFFTSNARQWAALTGIALGLAGLAHGVPGIVGVLWFIACAGTLLLSQRMRFLPYIPNIVFTGLTTGVITLVPILLVGSGSFDVDPGVWGGDDALNVLGIDNAPAEFSNITLDGDWTTVYAEDDTSNQAPTSSRFYVPPTEIGLVVWANAVRPFLEVTQNVVINTVVGVLVLIVLVRAKGDTRYLGYAFLILIVIITLMALAFSYRYETDILARHPINREVIYLELFALFVLILGLDRWVATTPRLQRRGIVFVGAVGLLLATLVARTPTIVDQHGSGSVSANGRIALAWLQQNTAPDAVLVANAWSFGSMRVLSDREVLTDGRQPFLQPNYLAQSLSVLIDFKAFFDCPSAEALNTWQPDYVVFTLLPLEIAEYIPFSAAELDDRAAQLDALLAYAPLTLVQQFDDVYIFRVNRDALAADNDTSCEATSVRPS